jgi:hypothetical protein
LANKFREPAPEKTENSNTTARQTPPAARRPRRPAKKGVLARALSSVFSGTFLGDEKNIQHLPFVLFVALLALMYIANGYYADDKIREANRTANQLKELRSEYIYTKSELMFASKQSEVAKSAAAFGLHEPVVPPVKILTDSARLYGNHLAEANE